MTEETSGLSRSVEDYLKAIYALCGAGTVASTSSIADALDVQPASVTGMVKRLAESGFLEHVPYRGVQLTDLGTIEALRVLRRHRILESYLTQRLGYRWEDVHREAERLEHAASDELVERMARALENPSHDPHGAPIPTSAGEIETTDSYNLGELSPGVEAQVRAVRDDHAEALKGVEDAGLLPGTRVMVLGRDFQERVVRVEVGAAGTVVMDVPFEVAHRVYVVTRHLGLGEG
ncbi:MAG: metal-dependent transcriptional regulator [Gemmatimonadota bacterium]|jgi:DtxR family Mn-dependent transcriptional regulator